MLWNSCWDCKFGFVGMMMEVRLGDYIKEYSVRNKNDEDIPVYSVTNTQGFCQDYFSKEVASKDRTTYKIVPRGFFAYNPSRINVGSVDWQRNEDRVIVSPLYNVFSVSPELNQQYLYYYLKSDITLHFIKELATGSVRDNLKLSMLYEFSINIPAYEEQEKVIKRLDLLQSIISLRRKELMKLDEFIKARFVELFGDINTNNKGWDSQPLGELCTIVRGGSPRPIENYLGGDVPWIKIGDATKGDNVYLHATREHIIRDGVKKSRMVKAGSLIFANCGVSLGFARIITFDGCIHDGWLAMEDIDGRLDKVFLLQTLNQMTEHFRKIAPAGTQPNLNTAIMKAYEQIIPPLDLQREFIVFVHQVDKSKLLAKIKSLLLNTERGLILNKQA